MAKGKENKTEALQNELIAAKLEGEKWKNEYYRVFADMENLRKVLAQERHDVIKYRVEGFVENLLPILNSFNAALANEPSDPVLKNYLIGFKYVYKQLVDVLDQEGVKHIEPKVNDMFDAATMQAQEAIDSELPKDTIIKVISNGYKLHDHLIAPALVVVSKGKQEEENNVEETKE